MHSRLKLYLAVALLGGTFAIQITGCSLIGFGIGSLIDNARPTRYQTNSTRQFFAVRPGTRVVLNLRDSTTIAGRYRGWRDLPDSVYVPRYEAWRQSLPEGFQPPRLGEGVILTDRRHRTYRGDFAGFGLYTVRIKRGRWTIQERAFGEPTFDDLTKVQTDDHRTFALDSVAAGIETGHLPLRAELTIAAPNGAHHVDASTIATVTVPLPKNAKNVGLAVGVFADILVVAAVGSMASASSSSSSCEPSYTGGSYYVRGWTPTARQAPAPARR